jgi:hypothetical protein
MLLAKADRSWKQLLELGVEFLVAPGRIQKQGFVRSRQDYKTTLTHGFHFGSVGDFGLAEGTILERSVNDAKGEPKSYRVDPTGKEDQLPIFNFFSFFRTIQFILVRVRKR